jgi:hypothetical protein
MKERLLDVIKWALIFCVAGAVFYAVYPKYHTLANGLVKFNRVTGNMTLVKQIKEGLERR